MTYIYEASTGEPGQISEPGDITGPNANIDSCDSNEARKSGGTSGRSGTCDHSDSSGWVSIGPL